MLKTSLTKTLTAGVLCFSLATASLTPSTASAQISDDDAIVGLITLLLLGAAIHDRRSSRDPAPAPVVVQPRSDWRVLPIDCRRTMTTQRGNTIRFFGQRCMNNQYNHIRRLPDECHVRFRNQNGQLRQGWRARCLRDAGFRTNRH